MIIIKIYIPKRQKEGIMDILRITNLYFQKKKNGQLKKIKKILKHYPLQVYLIPASTKEK